MDGWMNGWVKKDNYVNDWMDEFIYKGVRWIGKWVGCVDGFVGMFG